MRAVGNVKTNPGQTGWYLADIRSKEMPRKAVEKETVVMTYETSVKLNTLWYLVKRSRSRGEWERSRRLAAIYWRLAGKYDSRGSSNETEVAYV